MRRILLIDDNKEITRINTAALRMRGYDVIQAFSLTEAAKQLREHTPDVILMEAILPDGSGLEFCKSIKTAWRIPILFLSRLSDSRDIVAGLRSGGDDYMTKPCDASLMAERVKTKLRIYDVLHKEEVSI